MSYSEILALLFDRYDRPALLLDEELRVLRFNEAAATSFGWLAAIVGKPLDEVVTLLPGDRDWRAPGAPPEEPVVRDAVAATSASHLVQLSTRLWHLEQDGDRYFLEMEARGRQSTMPPAIPRQPSGAFFSEEFRLEIDLGDARFGAIRQADPRIRSLRGCVGRRCYEVLFDRGLPCACCPIPRPIPSGSSAGMQVMFEAASYHVVRYQTGGGRSATITHRRLDEELVRRLVGAHLQALADRANLSTRERSVYELLALGRSLDEIAMILGITQRTVRFHQSNLLAKIGADSRLDLLRLLL